MRIYCDGSASPNPGRGGWGWHNNQGRESYGGELNTTNNRMEMTAILEALKQLPDGIKVTVLTDSSYCVKGLTVWRTGWKLNKWLKKGGEVPNRDLWMLLDKHIERLNVTMQWVKGHNGDEGNEKADRLANIGRMSTINKNSPARPPHTPKKVKYVEPVEVAESPSQIEANEECGYRQLHEYIKQLEERIVNLEAIAFPIK